MLQKLVLLGCQERSIQWGKVGRPPRDLERNIEGNVRIALFTLEIKENMTLKKVLRVEKFFSNEEYHLCFPVKEKQIKKEEL